MVACTSTGICFLPPSLAALSWSVNVGSAAVAPEAAIARQLITVKILM